MSKGSTQRPTDKDVFDNNYDVIFRKKSSPPPSLKESPCMYEYLQDMEDIIQEVLNDKYRVKTMVCAITDLKRLISEARLTLDNERNK